MSSQGTGSPITSDVAMDLLHKLITESRNVQAAFGSGVGVVAVVFGVVKVGPGGAIAVMPRNATIGSPTLVFKPSEAISWTYGDDRAMPNSGATVPGGPTFSSALCCILRDGSQLSFFEIR
jgi:hypothetical protein